ncbi:MAG: ribose 5-phosphate isomerase A, partial [Methylotenera sp.]|nr:ribose 5-phosphate isomerase A [Methylotenera sp.]
MNDKQLVALQAAKYVKDGMLVGLGTGSTANYFIEELARCQQQEGLKITTVASSTISAQKAQSLQLPIVALEHISSIDLYVDGADEIDPQRTLLKGRGSDLVKEKLLAKAATQFIAVADESKLVSHI